MTGTKGCKRFTVAGLNDKLIAATAQERVQNRSLPPPTSPGEDPLIEKLPNIAIADLGSSRSE